MWNIKCQVGREHCFVDVVAQLDPRRKHCSNLMERRGPSSSRREKIALSLSKPVVYCEGVWSERPKSARSDPWEFVRRSVPWSSGRALRRSCWGDAASQNKRSASWVRYLCPSEAVGGYGRPCRELAFPIGRGSPRVEALCLDRCGTLDRSGGYENARQSDRSMFLNFSSLATVPSTSYNSYKSLAFDGRRTWQKACFTKEDAINTPRMRRSLLVLLFYARHFISHF